MLSGDNGILQKSTEAKISSEKAEAKEQARIDIMAWITDKTANHQDASLDDEKVKEILTGKSYVKNGQPENDSFFTAKGEYEIPYSELYQSSNVTPSEPETPTDKSTIILSALENVNYENDVRWKSNIRISDTSTAKFYDDDFNGTGYIEYNGAIYKISYISGGKINNIELTNIDISTLSVSEHKFDTIVSRDATYYETKEAGGTICYAYFVYAESVNYLYDSVGILIDIEDNFSGLT